MGFQPLWLNMVMGDNPRLRFVDSLADLRIDFLIEKGISQEQIGALRTLLAAAEAKG